MNRLKGLQRDFVSVQTLLIAVIFSFGASSAFAAPIWGATGPGTVTVTDADIGDDLTAEFTYLINPAGFSTRTWEFQTIAASTGPVTIDYTWTGFHAFFQVTTKLETFGPSGPTTIIMDGPVNCCTSPSNGFTYSGQVVVNAVEGQPYGFRLSGSNFDSNNQLGGTFTIQSPNDLVVDPQDCVFPAVCSPTVVQTVQLPEGVILAPGAELTQELLENPALPGQVNFIDPRVDALGQCSDRRQLDVFGDGSLILPRYLCGSPEFAVVLSTSVGIDVPEGVIRSEQIPEELFATNETFDCAGPVSPANPGEADLQRRGVFVWQPDDKTTLIERHAIELTNGCGSSKAAHRELSFFVINLHIDFGIDFGTNDAAVLNGLKILTGAKLFTLKLALYKARPALSWAQFRSLLRDLNRASFAYLVGNYPLALSRLETFRLNVEAATFNTGGGFNNQGNLLMRVENIEFIIDEKIDP